MYVITGVLMRLLACNGSGCLQGREKEIARAWPAAQQP